MIRLLPFLIALSVFAEGSDRGPRHADFAWWGGDPSALLARGQTPESQAPSPEQTARLKALVAAAGPLALPRSAITVTPPNVGFAMGMVSWVAMDRAGVIYLLQRGNKADPVVAIDPTGRVLRSWGRGMYVMPHAIRVDPQGNVWTTDAASSMVIKFTPEGKKLMEISVGGQPTPCRNNFCGTTDVAFGPNGRLFIADGYANARILEYTADGRRVREWGAAGTGPGQFQLPHSIVVDEGGIAYVADRENGRVQRFDLEGKFLGQWPDFGKTFSLALSPGAVWLATQPRTDPNLSPGWLMKVDRQSGKLLGYVEATGVHGMDARDDGTVLFGPGPNQTPQIYRAGAALQAQKPRARDLKLPIGGTAGPLDAITDVAGVEVGHTTLISGSGALVVGKGPVRTGVTVIHPRGKANADPVFAAWFTLNGNGEMTGTTWIQESGLLEGPVAITNTHSVGVVRDAIIQWEVSKKNALQPWWLPVVAETYDGGLNDINGFHVKPEHVLSALESAAGGLPTEGAVGGGTGMVCHGFKGGIGTASRKLPADQGGYTVGVLVQCNYGSRRDLRIAGVPVGEEITDLTGCIANSTPLPANSGRRRCDDSRGPGAADEAPEQGSIIVVVATDAPLLPHQLKRIATRVSLGIGRQGGFGGNGSGDIFVAFSTANARAWFDDQPVTNVKMLPNDRISPLFQATAQATEAAITNALLAAETTTGANDLRIYAMPIDRMLAAMKKYGRLP